MPVTVTTNIVALGDMHDTVELPPAVTLVGLTVQAALFRLRLTAALNVPRGVTLMVEAPVDPMFVMTVGGFAEIRKLATLTVMGIRCSIDGAVDEI